MSTTDATTHSSPSPAKSPTQSGSQIRFLILIGLLGLMLGALWYDRKVARPAVEDAYARIAKLNGEINSRPGNQFMTNQDVQKELKRTPISTFSEGGYMVEVYGWRAGLPTKTHNYYAVYTDDTQPIFLKHYMNYLDKEELKTMPLIVPPSENLTDVISSGDVHPSPLGGGGGQSRRNAEAKKSSEAAAEGESVLKKTEPDEKKTDEKKTETEDKPADAKKADEKKTDEKKPDNAKAEEKAPEEKKTEEKKPEEKKSEEKKPDEKKVEDKKESATEKPADGQPEA